MAKAQTATGERTLTDNVKFQHIHSFPRVKRQWRCLTKDEKLYVLEGMDLGLTETWVLSLIDEVRDLRRNA